MGSGVPDEIIRVRWVAEFKDNARGLITQARRATAELSKAHRTQRREQEATSKTTRQMAADIENLGVKYQRAAKLFQARGLVGKEGLREMHTLRRELKGAGVDIDKTGKMFQRFSKERMREFQAEQRKSMREARRLGLEIGLTREEVRKSISAFGDNSAALRVFQRRYRDAKESVEAFTASKRKEVGALRNNRDAIRSNSSFIGRFAGFFRNAGNAMRFSTNEMILWNRMTRLLRVPAVLAFLGMFIQLMTAAAAGLAGFVSSLRPLVGLLAALPTILASGVQAMQVWKIATTNLGKSSLDLGKIIETSLIANAEDFGKMMEDLPKRAKSFARFLREEITPGFRDLRADLQDNIFRGLEVGLKSALPSLRGLRPELVATSKVIESFFIAMGRRVGGRDWAADLETQAKRTNKWMRQLIPVSVSVADGLRHITIAAGPVVDNLVKLATRGARWFEQWALAGRTSGQFAEFFRETNFVLGETIELLGSFGSGINNILGVAYKSIGKDILIDLTNASQAFQAWTESATGQNQIAQYFMDMKGPIYEAARLVRDLGKGLFRIGRQPGVEKLIKQVRTELGPALGQAITSVTASFGPALVTFITEIVKLMAVLAGSAGPLTAIVKAFTDMASIFRTLLTEFPLLSKFFLELVSAVAILRGIRFIAAISGIGMLVRMVGTLATSLRVAWAEAATLNRTMAMAPVAGGPMMHPRAAAGVLAPRGGGFGSRMGGMMRGVGGAMMSPTGVGVLGTGAMIGGLMLGGRGGAALGGAGIGLQLGAMFGPWGMAIGTAVGALGGFTAAVMLAKQGVGATAAAFANLEGSARLLDAAQDRRGGAVRGVRAAAINVDQSQLNLVQAQRTRRGMVRGLEGVDLQRVKRSQEYKQALVNERAAVLQLEEANIALFNAEKDRVKIDMEIKARSEKFAKRVAGVGQAARANIAGIRRDTAGISAAASPTGMAIGPDVEERTRRIAAAVGAYQERMNALASSMRNKSNPAMAAYAETAARLSKQINGIPKKKDIDMVFKVDRSDLGRGGSYDIIEGRRSQFNVSVPVTYRTTNRPPPGVAMGIHRAQRTGGMIMGPSNRDAVPIMAAGGEAILTSHGQRLVDAMGGQGAMDFILDHQRPHFRGGGMVQGYGTGGRIPAARNLGGRTAFDPLGTRDEVTLEGLLFGNKKQVANSFKALARRLSKASIEMIETIDERIRAQMRRLRRGGVTKEEKKMIERLRKAHGMAGAAGFKRFGRQIAGPSFIQERGELQLRRLELEQRLAGTFDGGGGERASFISDILVPALNKQVAILARQLQFAQRTGNAKKARETELALEQKKIELLEAQLAAQEAANSLLNKLAAPMSFEYRGQRFSDLLQTGVGI